MKIELKNIIHSVSLSEETNAFVADLYVNGKKIAKCSNNGRGGMTKIETLYSKNEIEKKQYRQLLLDAEQFAKTLPKKSGLPMTLDFYVDIQVDKDLQTKSIKKSINKLNKLSEKNFIVISKSKLEEYIAGKTTELKYKLYGDGKNPLNSFSEGVLRLRMRSIELKFVNDEMFYNKNLPK